VAILVDSDRRSCAIRPSIPEISVERTSRTSIYKCLLNIAAVKREEIRQALEENYEKQQTLIA